MPPVILPQQIMLKTQAIPIYDDNRPDNWHTFLYKASTGSVKATDTSNYANMAYMVAFTGDSDAPNTMNLDDYYAIVRQDFLKTCPFVSIQQFHDAAVANNWIANSFSFSDKPRNAISEYSALWGKDPVDQAALMNDAMLNCLTHWSPDHYIECSNEIELGYNSCTIVSAMLYLSTTWPEG